MKRIASIGLILLMSLQCMYKLGVITYFELNRDYIAEVLCINREKPITMCNGRCFLERGLDAADATTGDQGAVPPGPKNVDIPLFLISGICCSLQPLHLLEAGNSRYLLHTSSAHAQVPFHPPASLS